MQEKSPFYLHAVEHGQPAHEKYMSEALDRSQVSGRGLNAF